MTTPEMWTRGFVVGFSTFFAGSAVTFLGVKFCLLLQSDSVANKQVVISEESQPKQILRTEYVPVVKTPQQTTRTQLEKKLLEPYNDLLYQTDEYSQSLALNIGKYGFPSYENLRFYKSYISANNYSKRIPNWVAEYLVPSNLIGDADRNVWFFVFVVMFIACIKHCLRTT